MTAKLIKMVIEYDGTNFFGWQRQTKLRTVQGEIERVLKKIFLKKIEIDGAGRTDANVHAYGQVATFFEEIPMPIENLKKILNDNLSEDVGIINLSVEKNDFHARYSAKGKTYIYKINNSFERNVFLSNYFYTYSYKLDDNKIKEAIKILIGKHDYKKFMASGSNMKDTIRTIYDIEIIREGIFISFVFTGDGFLYKMIRILTALLLEIGSNRLELLNIEDIFDDFNRKNIPEIVPGRGLYLKKVFY